MLFVCYDRCSTCRKAEDFLKKQGFAYEARAIDSVPPTAKELKLWHALSGLDIKKFFNTSGLIYRDRGLKDLVPTLNNDQAYALLAENGMLVKRPLLIGKDFVLIGFKESQWLEVIASHQKA